MAGAPTFVSDEIGADADSVFIVLGGDKIVINTGWQHTESILAQPSVWTLRMGWGRVAAEILAKYPKRTPFELYVGGVLQGTGRTDRPGAEQSPGGATEVTMSGRDALAPMHDTYVHASLPVSVGKYPDLVWFALQKCGLAPKGPIDPKILASDNAANRDIKAGVPIRAIAPHQTVQQILDDFGEVGPNAGTVHSVPQCKVGETWLRFVRRHIDRAGLFLWAAADGTFVLAAPDANQPPSYSIVRGTGEARPGGNVVACSFSDDGTHRHTEAIVYGKGGGKAVGRLKAKGSFVDQEMIDAGYTNQPIVFRDVHTKSNVEAALFARRKLAEERRAGYRLEYTISGLTLPYLPTGGANRAVVTVDTVVSVDDRELGIQGDFYVETVTRSRSPQTTAKIRLMRTQDLLFGGVSETES